MKKQLRTKAPARPRVGIADALFTKVQQRVLGILFGNPGWSFYANEVIALAGSGTGAVQRELTRLEAAGLLTVTRVGNQKHYRANTATPVFEELRGLVLKASGLSDVLLKRGLLTPRIPLIRWRDVSILPTRGACPVPGRIALARLPTKQPLHRLSGVAPYLRLGAGGVARAG
jgi:hypothetical protein